MALAQSHLHLRLLVILLCVLSFKGTSTSYQNDHGHKSLHFVLYMQETYNKTGFETVPGIDGPSSAQKPSSFGSLYVLRDPLTVALNSSSKVVGTIEGPGVTTSFDGFSWIIIYKCSLQLKHHEGSVVIVGGLHNLKPTTIPVVGGTGDFLFVQGYVRTSLVGGNGIHFVYKIEFHLYWPPYAN